MKRNSPHTEKNFRRIINPEKGFMTAKSVYQRTLPFDKPFFLIKVSKGLSPVAKRYTPVLASLLVNPFFVDQQNQPSNTEFIITYKKRTI
jgi:hypothetical protein